MRRIIFLCVAVMLVTFTLGLTAFARQVLNVDDNANILTPEEETYLQERIEKIEKLYGYNIILVSADNFFDASSFYDYAIDYDDNYFTYNNIVFFIGFYENYYDYWVNAYGRFDDEIEEISTDRIFVQALGLQTYAEIYNEWLDIIESQLEGYVQPTYVDDFIGVGGTIAGYDPMVDAGGFFTELEEQALFERIKLVEETYDFDITFLTMEEIPNNEEIIEYCDWYLDLDTQRDGVVFAININGEQRGYASSTRNEAQNIFSYDALDAIDEYVVPKLSDGMYYDAFNLYIDYTIEFLEVAKTGEYYTEPLPSYYLLLFVYAIPVMVALLVGHMVANVVLVAFMSTAKIKTNAFDFIKKDSFILSKNTDTFVKQTVTKKYSPASTSSSGGSSGGGGSRSGRGGSRGGRSGSF